MNYLICFICEERVWKPGFTWSPVPDKHCVFHFLLPLFIYFFHFVLSVPGLTIWVHSSRTSQNKRSLVSNRSSYSQDENNPVESSCHIYVNMRYLSKERETCQTYCNASMITADGNSGHKIKRWMFLGRKAMTNLNSILKSRDITLPTKVRIVKAMVYPVSMY